MRRWRWVCNWVLQIECGCWTASWARDLSRCVQGAETPPVALAKKRVVSVGDAVCGQVNFQSEFVLQAQLPYFSLPSLHWIASAWWLCNATKQNIFLSTIPKSGILQAWAQHTKACPKSFGLCSQVEKNERGWENKMNADPQAISPEQ